MLDDTGSESEPIRRQELWFVFLTIGVVLISFLVSEFAGRMRAAEPDATAPWAQFA